MRRAARDRREGLVEELDVDGKEAVFLHGLGLGYHAQALLDRATGAELFIIETDLELIRAACWSRDLTGLLDSPRVFLLWQHDKDAFTVALQPHVAAIHLGNVSVEHPASVQRCPARVAEHRRWIEEFIEYAKTTVNTMVLNGKRTCENVCNNLPLYVSSPSVGRLRDATAMRASLHLAVSYGHIPSCVRRVRRRRFIVLTSAEVALSWIVFHFPPPSHPLGRRRGWL